MSQRLKSTDDIKKMLAKTYRTHHRSWLKGAGTWPLTFSLGQLTEEQASREPNAVRAWINDWQSFDGDGELTWCERKWKTIGSQRLPAKLSIHGPAHVANWIFQDLRWQKASQRYASLIDRWPSLEEILHQFFDVLADYDDRDIERLQNLLKWLEDNRYCDLFLRQLPVYGLHTKWFEEREHIVRPLIRTIYGDDAEIVIPPDIFELCGIKRMPDMLRMRILDPSLRSYFGGFSEVSIAVDQLAGIDLPVSTIYFVENVQTGLAFDDIEGAIVIMGRGYALNFIDKLSWIHQARCIYWGDIDTHGFAILNYARSLLPCVESVLMDVQTIEQHLQLSVEEIKPYTGTHLPFLTPAEHDVYDGLREQRWGFNRRLEQERIPWDSALEILAAARIQRLRN